MKNNLNEIKEIRYIDLFGGVGGFRLGIERATNNQSKTSRYETKEHSTSDTSESLQRTTTRCVFYSDIDKYSVQTYNKNFKENYEATDIRTIEADSIPDFDMLCGGFPCQAFSIAGKRRGFEDTRGTLFFEVARIIKVKRPKIVFLENVKGLLNHDKGNTFRTIIQTLSELGYDVQWMVLNSKFFGVPQNRERVFIIGSLRGTSRPEILPFGETSGEFDGRNAEKQIASSLQHPGHSGGNYKGMNMVQEPKMIGQLQVEGERRVNECPLEINQFLKKNKGKLTIKEIAEKIGEPSSKVEHYFRTDKSRAIPKPSVWLKLQQVLHFPDTYNKQVSELEKFYVEFEQTRRVYSDDMSPTLNAGQPSIHAVLTPDRENKRQNGRRFKEEGEPSFTLTGQDVHGIAMIGSMQEHSAMMKNCSPALTEAMGKGGGHIPMKVEKSIMDLYNNKEHTDRSPALTEPHHNTLRVKQTPVMSKEDIEEAIKKGHLKREDVKGDVQFDQTKMSIRRLTPIECERLQGFPDNWTEGVSDTQRYKQMGNAVTVNVIQAIAEKLFAKTHEGVKKDE